MRLNVIKTAISLIAITLFGICLACAQTAYADTDTGSGVKLTPPETVYNIPQKPKPTTTTEKTATNNGGADQVYSPGHQATKQNGANTRGGASATSSTSTTTTERTKKRTDAMPASVSSTTTTSETKKQVAVAGEQVENPNTAKPFDLGIDVKPYLAMAILLMLSVTTGYSRTAGRRGAKGRVIKKGTTL